MEKELKKIIDMALKPIKSQLDEICTNIDELSWQIQELSEKVENLKNPVEQEEEQNVQSGFPKGWEADTQTISDEVLAERVEKELIENQLRWCKVYFEENMTDFTNSKNVHFSIAESENKDFQKYLSQLSESDPIFKELLAKNNIIAILSDESFLKGRCNNDLLFTAKRLYLCSGKKCVGAINYADVIYEAEKESLSVGVKSENGKEWLESIYKNNDVDMEILFGLITELAKGCRGTETEDNWLQLYSGGNLSRTNKHLIKPLSNDDKNPLANSAWKI